MDDRIKIHALYIISILITIIIALTTSKWGDNPRLVEYVNFFATLSSLVLAILAIVYAYLSNAAIAQSMNEIRSASDAISTTADDVSKAASDLRERVEAIPPRLESFDTRFDELKSMMTSPKMDTAPKDEKVLSDAAIDSFFEHVSLNGLLSVYGFYLAHSSKKPFVLSDLFQTAEHRFSDYANGVLVTLSTFGAVSHTEASGMHNITNLHPRIVTAMDSSFEELVQMGILSAQVGADEGTKSRISQIITETREHIKNYFEK